MALGDSFTEGLWDVPGGEPPARTEDTDPSLRVRGWADLLAMHLAERSADTRASAPVTTASRSTDAADATDTEKLDDGDGDRTFRYANLAIRGRLLGPILTEQVPAALALRPDLVSLVGGGNDMLRPTVDPDAMAADLEAAVRRLRRSGVDVLLATGMDAKDSPLVRRTRGRVAVLNSHIWSIARREDAAVLDLWGMRSLRDWRMWAPDRIHLTGEGHRRVAQGALVALGLAPDDAAWDDPMVPLPPLPRTAQLRDDAQWFRDHAYPWATRRLRGRSSGDLRRPKQPQLRPVL